MEGPKIKPAQNWDQFLKDTSSSFSEKPGSAPVLLLISGGVDSTVLGALLLKTLKSEQVHLMYMDTGLMRKNESVYVKKVLEKLGAKHIHIISCENDFLRALKGKTDPEIKRKTIGDLFIKIQERETKKLGLGADYFLAQGTIYPDVIESGSSSSPVIKSHHNVGSPLVAAKRKAGLVIEPLEKLYKDGVRSLGRYLGLEDEIINRHPFPGPGLAVRILGEVTKEKCDILREADAIFIEELKKRKSSSGKSLYNEIWQAYAALLPVKSVGISRDQRGDRRSYGWALVLRAINSTDAMSAKVYPFQSKDLLEISERITKEVPEINRVVYDISNKPPATIEWE